MTVETVEIGMMMMAVVVVVGPLLPMLMAMMVVMGVIQQEVQEVQEPVMVGVEEMMLMGREMDKMVLHQVVVVVDLQIITVEMLE